MVGEPRPVGRRGPELHRDPPRAGSRGGFVRGHEPRRLLRDPDGVARSAHQGGRGGEPAVLGRRLLEGHARRHAPRAGRALRHQRARDGEARSIASRSRTICRTSPARCSCRGGGQDHITPGTEAWRIFDAARSEREIVFYPRGGHDCFNVMSDLRPRLVAWVARQLEPHRGVTPRRRAWDGGATIPHGPPPKRSTPSSPKRCAARRPKRVWHESAEPGVPVRWEWPWFKGPVREGRSGAPGRNLATQHLRAPCDRALVTSAD